MAGLRSLGHVVQKIIRFQIASPNEVSSVATLPGDVDWGQKSGVSPDGHEVISPVSLRENPTTLIHRTERSVRDRRFQDVLILTDDWEGCTIATIGLLELTQRPAKARSEQCILYLWRCCRSE